MIGIVYAVGVVWCLLVSDAKPGARIVLAVLWPIGPLAFVVTLAILIAAAVSDSFGDNRAWLLVSVVGAAYIVSRGLAKAGTEHDGVRQRTRRR